MNKGDPVPGRGGPKNMGGHMAKFVAIAAAVAALLVVAGCQMGGYASRVPSLADGHPALFTRAYQAAEAEAIKDRFGTDPTAGAEAYGQYQLARLHRIWPALAEEYAQVPELADGFDDKEARAFAMVVDMVERVNPPAELIARTGAGDGTVRLMVEWEGEGNWNGRIISAGDGGSFPGRVVEAKGVNLEPGESVTVERGTAVWTSNTTGGDHDGMLLTLVYPLTEPLYAAFGGQEYGGSLNSALSQGVTLRRKGDGSGWVRFYNGGLHSPASQAEALADMIAAGEGGQRFSASLQALLWGYMDGTFKAGSKPLEHYRSGRRFVQQFYYPMRGPRWDDADVVVKRVGSDPDILAYYERHAFRYKFDTKAVFLGGGPAGNDPLEIFRKKAGNCVDYMAFTVYALSANGIRAWPVIVDRFGMSSKGYTNHVTTVYERNGLYYVIDQSARKGHRGPFRSEKEAIDEVYH